MKRSIYFDNSATTKVCPQAVQAALTAMEEGFGNPSSLHGPGAAAARALTAARHALSACLQAKESEIYFTSGGSEGNNTVIHGAAAYWANKTGKRILVSAVEHPSVLEPAKYWAAKGYDVQKIPVDEKGLIQLEALSALLNRETCLVSVMHVNNETGAVQPLAEIGERIRRLAPEALYHIDGVQAFGRLPAQLSLWQADAYTLSGHKIHAPKGCGALWLRQGKYLPPLILGGGQEKNLRSGTENMPGILALAAAAEEICGRMQENDTAMRRIKNAFLQGLQQADCPEWLINGPDVAEAAPHILNISFPGAKSEVLLHYLEGEGVYVSSGSACSSHSQKVSHVLSAMGLSPGRIESALRFSFCPYNTVEEAEQAAKATAAAVREVQRMMGAGKKRR
ncbi:MAG: cysteine desulfurase [Firmicutes bacterium]|nr:cysteine desulfurase [Bacillota bacterium]